MPGVFHLLLLTSCFLINNRRSEASSGFGSWFPSNSPPPWRRPHSVPCSCQHHLVMLSNCSSSQRSRCHGARPWRRIESRGWIGSPPCDSRALTSKWLFCTGTGLWTTCTQNSPKPLRSDSPAPFIPAERRRRARISGRRRQRRDCGSPFWPFAMIVPCLCEMSVWVPHLKRPVRHMLPGGLPCDPLHKTICWWAVNNVLWIRYNCGLNGRRGGQRLFRTKPYMKNSPRHSRTDLRRDGCFLVFCCFTLLVVLVCAAVLHANFFAVYRY